MLTDREKQFVQYWEQVRAQQGTTRAKLLNGLPMAVLFCTPILLLVGVVYLFLPEWYTRISDRVSGSMITIVIAVLICVIFYAYFRMHYKWEMNEQKYQELKSRNKQNENLSESK